MGVFLLKRLATFLATLLVASAVVFACAGTAAGQRGRGDPGRHRHARGGGRAAGQAGAGPPALQRYTDWVGGWLQGRTADSISYDTPTAELIAERLR
jgi:peptide/nickel transport system permease protein